MAKGEDLWTPEALTELARAGPLRSGINRTGSPSTFGVKIVINTDQRASIRYALRIIQKNTPAQYQPHREALHSALLGSRYEQPSVNLRPEELDHELRPIADRARVRGLQGATHTLESLKQAVEASVATDRDRDWMKRAERCTWTKGQRRKLAKMRLEARRRLRAGGDPDLTHRLTRDLPLEDGWSVPGTVTDGYLARKPRLRQGPRVTYEESRQILFELATGTFGLPVDTASRAVEKLLLFYLGESSDWESLRRWWFRYRPKRRP